LLVHNLAYAKFFTMKTFVLSALVCLLLSSCTNRQPEIFTGSSTAINGYDPVAYFTDQKPVKGNPEFTYQWKDANWIFSSQQNLQLFEKDPEKYAPQYGGYCAYGCSKGKKVTTDPNAWTIVDGKLYLNHNAEVKELWMKEQKERIEMADKQWPGIKDK
jgi:YHS domain-containing protein